MRIQDIKLQEKPAIKSTALCNFISIQVDFTQPSASRKTGDFERHAYENSLETPSEELLDLHTNYHCHISKLISYK
jgi:hypothetical protein